jgi:lysozyme
MNPKNKLFLGVVGATLVASAALWEGDKREPYYDIVGVLTVCYGYTGSDIILGKRYTKLECDDLLVRELKHYNVGILQCINVPVQRHEVDAYTLFAYNVGIQGFCRSSLLRQLNAGNHKAACDGLLKWSYAGGKYVQGLNNRRQYERQMCLGELNAKT